MIFVVAIVIVAGALAIFAIAIGALVLRTRQLSRASADVLPAFARAHGMAFAAHGSPDRLARVEGVLDGAPITVELVLARSSPELDEQGRPVVHVRVATRVSARAAHLAPACVRIGAAHEGGHDGSAPWLAPHAREVAAFAARRGGTLRVEGGEAQLEWVRAEDDLEALDAGARLVARIAAA